MTHSDNMPTPLNGVLISEQLSKAGFEVEVEVLKSVDSTNTRLLDSENSPPVVLCAAEHQTVGRGRRGKTWHSPDSGITFSMRFDRPEPVSHFTGLSLLVGTVLCDSLRNVGVTDAMVKWPNDVLVEKAKLAGILIESRATASKQATVLVVGMGVNYKRGDEARLIDQASTDLNTVCGSEKLPDRSVLIADIATRLLSVISGDVPTALSELSGRWARYDALAGKSVNAEVGGKLLHGVASGIDENGNLRLATDDGLLCLNSADVTVRTDARSEAER